MDIDIFLEARKVLDALRNRDCSEALAWCSENKTRLKKSKVLYLTASVSTMHEPSLSSTSEILMQVF